MKLAIVLSTNNIETNWNALRLANLALSKDDTVSVFLVGEGVEYEKNSSDHFDIRKQVEQFLESGGEIIACGTCLDLREQEGSKKCPTGNLEDWYRLVAENDNVLTF